MGICIGEKQACKTWQENKSQMLLKRMNIMSDVQTSAEMKWFLLNDWELWLFIRRRNKSTQYALLPKILFSLNLYTLWLFFIYQNRSRSDSLTWFNSVCLEIIVTVRAEMCFDDFDVFHKNEKWEKKTKTKTNTKVQWGHQQVKRSWPMSYPNNVCKHFHRFSPHIPFTMSLLLLRQPHLSIDLICLAKRSSDPSTLHVAHLRHPKGCQVRIVELTRVQTSASRTKKRSSGCQGNVGNS